MRFDESFDECVRVPREGFVQGLPPTTLVRDPAGLLTVVLPDGVLTNEEVAELAAKVDSALGRYSPGRHRVVFRVQDLVDERDVLESPDRVKVADVENLWIVDRLLTNQDWLRAPPVDLPPIPAVTAFGIKGGVGRSTALAAAAVHLA